nr:tyrosine-type recombinase/integrase [Moritella viscosa]SHO06909.1 Integrase [Moritella viscosa]
MSVRNLKDGNKKPWLCECYPNGTAGRRIRKRFATKSEATAFEHHTIKETEKKPWLGTKKDKRHLLELIDLWHKLHGKNLKSGDQSYNRLQVICEQLNNPVAAELTANDYVHYRATRLSVRNSEESLAKSTHNYEITILNTVFNELIKMDEWKLPNPFIKLKKFKLEEKPPSFLNDKQIDFLLEEINPTPLDIDVDRVIKICLSTGSRVMEAVNLNVTQLSKYKITFTNTKGKRNRTVPISKELYDEIHSDAAGSLFSCTYNDIRDRIKSSIDELPKGQATHILRHTFASHFMMNGGNILVLQQILGHTNIKQTMAYSHFAPSHLNDAILLNPLDMKRSKMV